MLLVLIPYYLALENWRNIIRCRKEKRLGAGVREKAGLLKLCGLANWTYPPASLTLSFIGALPEFRWSALPCYLRICPIKGQKWKSSFIWSEKLAFSLWTFPSLVRTGTYQERCMTLLKGAGPASWADTNAPPSITECCWGKLSSLLMHKKAHIV